MGNIRTGILIGSEKVPYAQSCTYLGMTFKGSLFSIRRLPMINYLVDIQPLMPLQNDMNRYNTKNLGENLWLLMDF